MKRLIVLIPTACILWASASQASDNLLTNGGFELPYAAVEYRYPPGSDMAGWLVGGEGNVLNYWGPGVAAEGFQYLYMPHAHKEISQAVTLIPGRNYELQLRAAATLGFTSQLDVVSYYPADTLQDSYVVGSATIVRPFVSPTSTTPQWLWEQHSFTFAARTAQERLFFRSGEMALDRISLIELPVPEPSSLVIASLAILGSCGRAFYRRRTALKLRPAITIPVTPIMLSSKTDDGSGTSLRLSI